MLARPLGRRFFSCFSILVKARLRSSGDSVLPDVSPRGNALS